VGSSPLEISQKQSLYVSYHIPSYVSSNHPPIRQSSCLLKRSDVLESDLTNLLIENCHVMAVQLNSSVR